MEKKVKVLTEKEVIEQIREIYGVEYNPNSIWSAWEQLEICETVAGATPIKEKKKKRSKNFRHKVVGTNHTTLPYTNNLNLRTLTRETAAFGLATRLDDLENLPWYEKLVNERRRDFLTNCLVITLNAEKQGKIRKTKGAYFAGVVKQKTALQQRIKKYKAKHTT